MIFGGFRAIWSQHCHAIFSIFRKLVALLNVLSHSASTKLQGSCRVGSFPIFIMNSMKRKQFIVIVFHGDVDFLPFHLQTMSKTAKRLEPFSWNFKALYNVSVGWLPLQLSPWYFSFSSNISRGCKYQFQLPSGEDLTNSFTSRF